SRTHCLTHLPYHDSSVWSVLVRVLSSSPTYPFDSPRLRSHHHLPSFPTRRSSDLNARPKIWRTSAATASPVAASRARAIRTIRRDRKSTRLNSSHEWISYAVFCLKKNKDI